LITKIAYRDFGHTALAHGVYLIFVFYQAANRGATPGDLPHHEPRELAGRAYRHHIGSVVHHALIPHQSRGELINGQAPGAASETTQWLAKSKIVRPRTVNLRLKFRLFLNRLRRYSKDGICDQY
jgi:hypothetical protein